MQVTLMPLSVGLMFMSKLFAVALNEKFKYCYFNKPFVFELLKSLSFDLP